VRLVLFLLLLPSIASFLTMIYMFYAKIFQLLPSQEVFRSGLILALLPAVTIVFFFGLFYLLSAFFFAQDTERLLPLPLSAREIVGGRFAAVLVNEYLTLLPLLLPALIAWARLFPQPFFWPQALLVFLLLPVVPLAVCGMIVLVVMRFVNLPRGRDFWRVAGILISVAAAFGVQFLTMKLQRGFRQEELSGLLIAGRLKMLAGYCPPVLQANDFLAGGSLLAFAELLLFSVLAVTLFLWVAKRFFLAGVVGGTEMSKSRKKRLPRQKRRSVLPALLWRETALLVRNPVFLTNGLLNLFLPPVLLFFVLRGSAEIQAAAALPGEILELVVVGFIAALPALSVLPATSISREGKQFWLSRLIPVSPQLQVCAKLLASSLATLAGGMVFLVALGAMLPLSPLRLLGAFAIGLVGSVGVCALSVLVDALWPNLEWTDPQKAMKGNVTSLYAMLLGALYLGLPAFLAYRAGWGAACLPLALSYFVLGDLLWVWLLFKRAPGTWREG
jgi:ABC-2 type transport system permease protein